MESNRPLSREILDEDLQILRHTLAAISDDVRRFSPRSAQAVNLALENLTVAHQEFSRSPEIDGLSRRKNSFVGR